MIRRKSVRTKQPAVQPSQSLAATRISRHATKGARGYEERSGSERRPRLHRGLDEVAGLSNRMCPRLSATGFLSAHRLRAPCLPGFTRTAKLRCSCPRRRLEGIPSSGASGAVGRHVIAGLLRQVHVVTDMTRSEAGARLPAELRAEVARVSAFDGDAAEPALLFARPRRRSRLLRQDHG